MFCDAFICLWIWFIWFALFFCMPQRVFRESCGRNILLRMCGLSVRFFLLTVVTVGLLATLQVLNAVTLAFVYASLWLILRARDADFSPHVWKDRLLNLVRKAELLLFRVSHQRRILISREWTYPPALGVAQEDFAKAERYLLAGVILLVFVIALGLRLSLPLHDLRYPDVRSYEVLLRTRELLVDLHPWRIPLSAPAICAAISSLAGVNSMQVIRFMAPVFSMALVVSAGVAVASSCRSNWGGVFTAYVVGAFTLLSPAAMLARRDPGTMARKVGDALNASLAQQSGISEIQCGIVFLLLAAAFMADWRYWSNKHSLVDAGCSLVLVALCAPTLMVPGAIGILGLFVSPSLLLLLFSLGWGALSISPQRLAIAAWISYPPGLAVSLALAVGIVLAVLERAVRAVMPARVALITTAAFVGVLLLYPQKPVPAFLEYDAAARETLLIQDKFPRGSWKVIGPIEQFSEAFGFGQYEDLHEFIQREQDQGRKAPWGEPHSTIFVFVETRPFQTFKAEPLNVAFSSLADPTYRNYRSSAGRASLELAALRMCEEYRSAHPADSIFYEDEALRIYRLVNK